MSEDRHDLNNSIPPDEALVGRIAQRLAEFADKMPAEARDAPFIYSHRVALARIAVQELLNANNAEVERRRQAEARAASMQELIVRLHKEGTLSEGQASKALQIGRVDLRKLADDAP
jgi:hypothetical protein